jgi:hypothetical protein
LAYKVVFWQELAEPEQEGNTIIDIVVFPSCSVSIFRAFEKGVWAKRLL